MSLQLNEPRKPTKIIVYKEFEGKILDKMPQLISEGFSPMTFAQIMKKRLDVTNSARKIKESWHFNYFHTADALAINRNGTGKIIINNQIVRNLNPESKILNGGSLDVSDVYDSLVGEKLSKRDLEKYNEIKMSEKNILSDKIWNILAGEDTHLLKDYTKMIFSKKKQGYTQEMMGIHISSGRSSVDTLKLWVIGKIGDKEGGVYYSYALCNGFTSFFDDNSRLVGSMQKIEKPYKTKIVTPSLEQIMTCSQRYVAPTNVNSLRKELEMLYK